MMPSARMLPQRATVERAARMDDGMGGWSLVHATVAVDVPCRVSIPTARSVLRELGLAGPIRPGEAVIYLRNGVDVRVDDQIVVGGVVYSVDGVFGQPDGAYVAAKAHDLAVSRLEAPT